jgi:hypothetical protein
MIDYAVGLLVIAAPWLFGFSDHGRATAVTVGFGVAALLYSLLTNYELGVFRVLSMNAHLAIDVVWSIALIASPMAFGFADRVTWPHVTVGIAGLVVTALTTRTPRTDAPPAGRLHTT